MTHSFKFSTRHLLVVIAAAAFVFWLVKNYYDSKQLAEAQTQLRAAKEAGSFYLYDKLRNDKSVIGKKIDEYPGLEALALKPKGMNDRQLAEMAIGRGKIVRSETVRSAPATPAQTTSAEGESAEAESADPQAKPTVTYITGDRALLFSMEDHVQLKEGVTTTGFALYIRNGKILAIFDFLAYATY